MVPPTMVQSTRHELITMAACELIAHGISAAEINSSNDSTIPPWRNIVDFALKSPTISVQEAAADAMTAISKLVKCSAEVDR